MTHDTYELLIDTYQIGGDFSYWILPAVAVMRISKADPTTEFSRTQKVIAWLPFVTYLSANQLIETKVGAWKLFFLMCCLVVAFTYLEKWWVAQRTDRLGTCVDVINYFLTHLDMGKRTNRLTAMSAGALMLGATAAANAETLEGKTSNPDTQGGTVVVASATDYETRIAELSAQLAEIDCTGKEGLAMLKCSGERGTLESQIRLAQKQQKGVELAQDNQGKREANAEEDRKTAEAEAKNAALSETLAALKEAGY